MANDWDKVLKEPVSQELEHKTLARARQELDAQGKGAWDWSFIKYAMPLTAAALGTLLYFGNRKGEKPEWQKDGDFLAALDLLDIENIEDFEVLIEIDDIEDLELLEDWDGREES